MRLKKGVQWVLSILEWIEENLQPEICTTDILLYDDMESQSGYSIPILYKPFDAYNSKHWASYASALDFLYATEGEGGRLLDFGPGDGWPSLPVATVAGEVVGLDASAKRVEICTQNAERLGITNARFVSYQAGDVLPFSDGYFDGVMAASSVEQTPNPQSIVREFYRVLKPGGRFRIHYEGLARYRNGREREIWILSVPQDRSRLLVYDRNIEEEYVLQYGITLDLPRDNLLDVIGRPVPVFSDLTVGVMEELSPFITSANKSRTEHPSGQTWTRWLKKAGFSEVRPTHNGGRAGQAMYDWFSDGKMPVDLDEVDAAIKPAVKLTVELECPLEGDPRLTAVK